MKRPKLAYHRNKKGLTQKEVATMLGMKERQYGRIERGRIELSVSMMIRLKPILGVEHIEDLLEEEELRDS